MKQRGGSNSGDFKSPGSAGTPDSPGNAKKKRRTSTAGSGSAASTPPAVQSSPMPELVPPPPMSGYGDTIFASNPFDDTPPPRSISQMSAGGRGPSPQLGRMEMCSPPMPPMMSHHMGPGGPSPDYPFPRQMGGHRGQMGGPPMGHMQSMGGPPGGGPPPNMSNPMMGPGGPQNMQNQMGPGPGSMGMGGMGGPPSSMQNQMGPGGPPNMSNQMMGQGGPPNMQGQMGPGPGGMGMGGGPPNMQNQMGPGGGPGGPGGPGPMGHMNCRPGSEGGPCGPNPNGPHGMTMNGMPMPPGMGQPWTGPSKPLPMQSGKIYPHDQAMIFNPQNPNAPPIYPCGVCHKEVHDNDQAIPCESGCNFWFHRMCTGLTEAAYHFLTQEVYAEWVCDKCLGTKSIPLVKFKP